MMHRRLITENCINPNNLDLSKYEEEKEKLKSITTGRDKLLYMTIFLEKNIEIQDIFSNLFYSNNQSVKVNDLVKYYLIYMLSLLDNDKMKLYFPTLPIKNNNIIVDKDNPLFISKKLFQIFLTLLVFSEKDVQCTVLELLSNYSDMSNNFIDYCLEDTRIIEKIFNLTYNNNNSIINNSIIILDNIISYENCAPDTLEKLLQQLPIIQRCKELLSNNRSNNDIKINTLEILLAISSKINENYLKNYFFDFIKLFYDIIALQPKNEEIIMRIFRICLKLSRDDSLIIPMKDAGLADIFLQYLSIKITERDYLIILLQIFSNLFYSDEIIIYFIKDKNGGILTIFTSIINTYLHTLNEKNNKIFFELFFCLSNMADGPTDVKYIISKSEIPKLVEQVLKIKNNNDIFFEGIHFFKNIIEDSDKETFYNISECHPFRLYAKGLKDTLDIGNLDLCLSSIIDLISKNREMYNTIENIKTDLYKNLINKRICDLTYHKDKEISQKAETIIKVFEDKIKMDL